MKVIPDFENELKAIDPRLSVVQNPNNPLFANIKLDGVDVCPIPPEEIRDEPDPSYTVIAPNGWKMKHKSRVEALGQVHDILDKIKNPEFHDIFFGTE